MQYNQEIAEQLQKKYGFGASTLRTWKSRNYIPDRYMKEGFKWKKPASEKDLAGFDQLIALPFIKKSSIKGIEGYRVYDYMRGGNNALISKDEINHIKKSVRSLRRKALIYLDRPNDKTLERLLKHYLLRPTVFIDDKKLYDRIRKKLAKNFTEKEWDIITQKVKKLVEEQLPFKPNK